MTQSSQPITITLPENWTPEQAWAVHELLDELLERIEAHYGIAVQDWLGGADADAFTDTQLDLFDNELNDPLPF